MTIAIRTLKARIDPVVALAKAEARLRGATTIANFHRAVKATDEACESVLAIAAMTRADFSAQSRAIAWQNNRERRVSEGAQRIEEMEIYRNRRVHARPYAGTTQ